MLERAEYGRGMINVAPQAVAKLSPEGAMEFLTTALQYSEKAALGAVYIASMALHGRPIGDAVAKQISHGWIMRVRTAVSDSCAREIVALSREHSSGAVRGAANTYKIRWTGEGDS